MLTDPNLNRDPVHVVGATGRSGLAVCRALHEAGIPFVPLVRSLAKWDRSGRAEGLPGEPRVMELTDHFSLSGALHDAVRLVSCAHARHTQALVDATMADVLMVLLGSTRRFTRWPDSHGLGVMDGERVFIGSGRPGVMLHPTMIYGAEGEDNVQRLAKLLRRLPVVPLPGGGRALVQPIHQADVTRCILAALDRNWPEPETVVIAGPSPLPYADFVRAVAAAAGLKPPRVMPVPAPVLRALAPFTGFLPGIPHIGEDEIRRLTEDKAFDIMPMFNRLGVVPVPLAQGLAATFSR
jgi:nucleoside-diphosphate-sugar epimerase